MQFNQVTFTHISRSICLSKLMSYCTLPCFKRNLTQPCNTRRHSTSIFNHFFYGVNCASTNVYSSKLFISCGQCSKNNGNRCRKLLPSIHPRPHCFLSLLKCVGAGARIASALVESAIAMETKYVTMETRDSLSKIM